MEKPKKPIEPNYKDYPTPTESNAVNYLGNPLYQKLDWIADMKIHRKETLQYEIDLEQWQQYKFIRILKKSSDRTILRKYKITKISNR